MFSLFSPVFQWPSSKLFNTIKRKVMTLEYGSFAENLSKALKEVKTFCLTLCPSGATYCSFFTFNLFTCREGSQTEGPRLGSYCKIKHFKFARAADCLFSGKFQEPRMKEPGMITRSEVVPFNH